MWVIIASIWFEDRYAGAEPDKTLNCLRIIEHASSQSAHYKINLFWILRAELQSPTNFAHEPIFAPLQTRKLGADFESFSSTTACDLINLSHRPLLAFYVLL